METGNPCYKCGKGEYEPAGVQCRNPAWHVPPQPVDRESAKEQSED